MRREPLINALLGASSPSRRHRHPAGEEGHRGSQEGSGSRNNGDAGPGGAGLTDGDVERIADAVVSKLAAALSTG